MKQYLCVDCWHEIYSDHRAPQSIHWTDGHVCTFKSPEDIDTSLITKYEDLITYLTEKVDIPEDKLIDVHRQLQVAHAEEVKLMLRHALRAKLPKVILHPFHCQGSQHIAEFEVKDLTLTDDPTKMNFHLQNTSQWVYAGCILFDERDQRVSRHH